jgi:RHS repeat-associated protein
VPDATAGNLLDTVTADGNGNITSFTYDSAGNQTSATAPDGAGSQTATTTDWASAAAQGNTTCSSGEQASAGCGSTATGPAPVAPGGGITPPAAAPPAGVTWSLYDSDGNDLYDTTGVYEPGSGTAAYQQVSYSLYKGNSVTLGGTAISCTAVPPSRSLPCATINPDGVVTQLAYDAQGDLTSSSAPDGNGTQVATASYGFDGDGEQTSQTVPDGNLSGANAANYTTVTAYNADGLATSVTQAGGTGATVTPRASSYGYDADGNQTTAQDARGYTTTTAYNADDQVTEVTDPLGNSTLTCYDGDGNVTQTVPPEGVSASSLAPLSCPSAYPSGYGTRLASDATTYTFDGNGDQTAMTTPAPAGQSGHETTTFSYDGDGNPVKTTGPPASGSTDEVTYDTYDSAGNLATETTGYGTSQPSVTSYCYDPDGDQTSVVAPDGNTSDVAACETSSPWVISATAHPGQAAYQTTASYDSLGEVVSATSPATAAAPSGGTTSYGYDADGNVTTSRDPDGITTTSGYNAAGLLSGVSYSGSSAHSASYAYDASGHKTGMTDATGSPSYTWDPFGELTSATNGAGQTVGLGYDGDGDTTAVTYPLPASATWATTPTVSYGYSHADVLDSVTDFTGSQISVTDNADGLASSETLGSSGDTLSTTYDPADSPSRISLTRGSATLQSFAYSDAPAGNILSETDAPSSAGTSATYTYDTLGRVASMTPGSGSPASYGFDASGNLTVLPGGAAASYDHDSELTSAASGSTTTTYGYDADGRRLSATRGASVTASATWNGAGGLTSYTDTAGSTTSQVYDGDGLRASGSATPAGGSATAEDYAWNTATPTPQLLMDSSDAYIYTGAATPAEQVSLASGTARYLVADTIGSVRGVVSASGSLTATASYDAWGNPEAGSTAAAATPFGFGGGYTDPTGLIYLVNRYYDPTTGQFLSVDPEVSLTQAPYSYASGDPVGLTDPDGLCTRTTGKVRCRTDKLLWRRNSTLHDFQYRRDKVCGKPEGNCNNHGDSHGKFLDWSSDQCSGSPDSPHGWPFWKACERHDFGRRNYVDQSRCTKSFLSKDNTNFYNDLKYNVCNLVKGWEHPICVATAVAYKKAVDELNSCS